jgi:PIN domain nuclease of toxin-antitoxin system
MRVLLDTHIALWALAEPARLDRSITDLILADETDAYVSAASWWEVAIKIGLGKLPADLVRLRTAASQDAGFIDLPVHGYHTEVLLDLAPIHKDPFDRLLIAQAIAEPMKLLTADSQLAQYSSIVWVVGGKRIKTKPIDRS